jgi:hypothetical protein
MDSLAYMVHRNFVLVAVDTHFDYEIDGKKLHSSNAKKVYKLNDHHLISVIGDPQKISHIYRYVLSLKQHNKSFHSIIEDLNDAFNDYDVNVKEALAEFLRIIPRFYDQQGHFRMEELTEYLKPRPEMISLLSDIILSAGSDKPLTTICLFAWEKDRMLLALLHSMGNFFINTADSNLPKDTIEISFESLSLTRNQSQQIIAEAKEELNLLLLPGWENNHETVNKVLDHGKETLAHGLKKINQNSTEPNVIFYELSPRTSYKFIEPDIKLENVLIDNKSIDN